MRSIATATLLASLLALPGPPAAVNLNGRWHFNGVGSGTITTVTQTGSALSIPLVAPFSGSVGATDANGFTGYSVSWTDGTNQAGFGGRIMPSGNLLDGRAAFFSHRTRPKSGGVLLRPVAHVSTRTA